MFTANTNVFEIVDMFSVRHRILLIFKCIFVNFHVLNTKIKCKRHSFLQNQCSFINFNNWHRDQKKVDKQNWDCVVVTVHIGNQHL